MVGRQSNRSRPWNIARRGASGTDKEGTRKETNPKAETISKKIYEEHSKELALSYI
jgi:hypothetical protein